MSLRLLLLSFLAAGLAFGTDLSVFSFSDLTGPSPRAALSASISNVRTSAAVTADVTFYRGSVIAGNAAQINTQTVVLQPFANTRVNSPEISIAEGELYSVCVDTAQAVPESNENNNCDVRAVSTAQGDLSIATAGIVMTPTGAEVGEPIRVTANIQNLRNVVSRALVRLFQGHPQSPGAKQLAQTVISVPANGFAPASWTVTRPEGDTNLFVSIDDVYPRESNRANNLATRNVYLKAIVDTGRMYDGKNRASTMPAVGDLLGTGQPVLVFGEQTGSAFGPDGRLTAVQVQTDGTTKELWSKQLVPAPSQVLSPSMADLDGDHSPEIIVEAVRPLGTTDAPDGEIDIFALDKDGNKKWTWTWHTVGRRPCQSYTRTLTPILGDMNKDGVADVVLIEKEIVILDGRNGAELLRQPNLPETGTNWCGFDGYAAIADVDADGSNEIIVGNYGIYVFNSDATLRWKTPNNNMRMFSITDTDNDGTPELVVPVHKQSIDILDAKTGALKKRVVPSPWSPSDETIAVTTNVDATGLPTIALASNDGVNGTAVVDNQLNQKWWSPSPIQSVGGALENPHGVALADLLGQGRPQVISRSDRRSIGIQDIRDGSWMVYTSIYGFGAMRGWPIPVDADGDGHGDVIINYGLDEADETRLDYDTQLPPANFLIFSSDHWQKIPTTWNQHQYVPNQVDRNLAFRNDYLPYKTHNSWMQQPLRKQCDIDYDDDVDQNDINLIYAARGQQVTPGDWRDVDKDGQITISDGRACVVKCVKPSCAAINQPAHILSVSPRAAYPGTTVQATIRGEFGNFRAGITKASFGAGISVGGAAAGAPGPVTVIDTDTATAQLTIAAGQSGDRDVTVTTGSITAARAAGFSLSAANRPPAVHVTTNQHVVLPAAASLSGTVTDDGLPGAMVTTSWQMVGGPGIVTFSNPSALSTTAAFSKDGFYTLRLSATDGQYVASADVGVVAVAGNQPPLVNAGPDTVARQDVPLRLAGDVQDDGLPSRNVNVEWVMVSGPGTASFSPANTPGTLVSFSQPGTYMLRLMGDDSQLSASDDVTVTVAPPPVQIVSLTPDSAAPGQATVTIRTKYSHFVNGTTEANFGAGLSVGGAAANTFGKVVVVDATTATALVQVAGDATLGIRTVIVRTGTEVAAKVDAFIVGALGTPIAIRVNPTDPIVAPGGSITVQPQLVDAGGNVVNTGNPAFTLTVMPKPGKTEGNAPQVNGLTVNFPKLAKQFRNQNVEVDPEGRYADGDPADPNYGKETGGIYTLTVQAGGLTGSIDVAVLPSGTADVTLKVREYSRDLHNAMKALQLAAVAHDVPAVLAAKAQLAGVLATTGYSWKMLSSNNVMAPPNGYPVSLAQVQGHFTSGPDDAQFAAVLDLLIVHLRNTRTRLEAIDMSRISDSDLDAWRAANATYKMLSDQLAALSPETPGVVANSYRLNTILRDEAPKLLDTMARKAMEFLNQMPGQEQAQSTAAFNQSSIADIDFYLNVMSELFPLATDASGYLNGNITELGITLANSLANIALANILNYFSSGSLTIDYVMCGADFSFACPNYPNTYVEGSGFGSNPEDNAVTVIGCLNSNTIRTLVGLKMPGVGGAGSSEASDIASAIRWGFDIKSLVDSASAGLGFWSVETPTEIRPGLFNGGSQMVFRNGWSQVNKSRIPCVGTVIAVNRETGGTYAVNLNMLASCQ